MWVSASSAQRDAVARGRKRDARAERAVGDELRSAEQEALAVGDAHGPQHLELAGRLDALRDHRDAGLLGERHEGADERALAEVVVDAADEGAVELEEVRIQAQHLRQRGQAPVRGAHGHPHTEAAEALDGGGEPFVRDGGGVGQLDDQAPGRLPGDAREERPGDHGRGGDVQREEARRGQLVELGDRQLDRQALEFDGQPDRGRVGEPAARPGVPGEARQRLRADHVPREQVDDRLQVHLDRARLQELPHPPGHRVERVHRRRLFRLGVRRVGASSPPRQRPQLGEQLLGSFEAGIDRAGGQLDDGDVLRGGDQLGHVAGVLRGTLHDQDEARGRHCRIYRLPRPWS